MLSWPTLITDELIAFFFADLRSAVCDNVRRQIHLAQERLIARVAGKRAEKWALEQKAQSGVVIPVGLLQLVHRLIAFAAVRVTSRDPEGRLAGVLLGQLTQRGVGLCLTSQGVITHREAG